ncbi:hypothetical protein KS4_25390 [Poriferisphaera corsica]|uniref:Uncharacterized protein n=1 Tax=Poriferisphaera corsica TaxID=2528020 RepID=A0A517YW86_9BACT|nr:hypothetical protein KS4_25390 [Poriferisphaera corsica]
MNLLLCARNMLGVGFYWYRTRARMRVCVRKTMGNLKLEVGNRGFNVARGEIVNVGVRTKARRGEVYEAVKCAECTG